MTSVSGVPSVDSVGNSGGRKVPHADFLNTVCFVVCLFVCFKLLFKKDIDNMTDLMSNTKKSLMFM